MRQAAIKRLQDGRREDLNEFLQFVQNPKIQKSLEMYIQSLKKKA